MELERLSQERPISGVFKQEASDFIVEEITQNGTTLETNKVYDPSDLGEKESAGRFTTFILQKTDWNTVQALREISKKLMKGRKSFGFAGTKDRRSISVQRCSIFGVEPSDIMNVHVKDVSINGAWKSDEGVKLGELLGNRFTIAIHTEDKDAMEKTQAIMKDLDKFPNYFGMQRFGNRGNNVEVGLGILKGDFEKSAISFLTDTKNETNHDAVEARKKLSESLDFKDALSYFPSYLRYERQMLESLAKNPSDYANALRKLPRQITLMFVHSVESYIFNKELGMRLRDPEAHAGDLVCKKDSFGFPDLSEVYTFNEDDRNCLLVGNIVGYNTKNITDCEKDIMEELGINSEDFRVKRMPELNCKGQYRVLFSPVKEFGVQQVESENVIKLGFSIPAGAYATALLNEIVR